MKDCPRRNPALPGSVTLASLAIGLVSMVMSAHGNFEWAAWLVVWSAMLDKADGFLARTFNAGSEVGVELDSFADFAAFGIAPAAYVWFRCESATDNRTLLIWAGAAAMIMVMAAAIRLAIYNVRMSDDREWFTGVASTFAAGLFMVFVLSLDDLGLQWNPNLVLPSLAILCAVAMLSRVRIPKLKIRLGGMWKPIQIVVGAFFVGTAVLQQLPELLFAAGMTYLVAGAIVGGKKRPGA